MRPPMKTATLTLTLIASFTLSACAPQGREVRRDQYLSREECELDWEAGDDKCRPVDERRPGGQYFGPYYGMVGGFLHYFAYSGTRMGTASQIAAGTPLRAPLGGRIVQSPGFAPRGTIGAPSVTTVSRGGFGASARGLSSSGS